MKVLDIGCGRGGGLAFLTDNFKPSLALGIDRNQRNVTFASQSFAKTKFSTFDTDYTSVKSIQQKFDLVLSIENWSQIYDKVSMLEQVKLILRQPMPETTFTEQYAPSSDLSSMNESQYGAGQSSSSCDNQPKFVIADRFEGELSKHENEFRRHFDIERRSEITLNVRHACKLQRKRRADLVRKALSAKVRGFVLDRLE